MKWFTLVLASLGLVVLAALSPAKRIAAPPNPIQRAFKADAVVVGKVTAIEKDSVDVADTPDGEKTSHRIAVLKIESAIAGAANLTHLKVGFVPPAPAAPPRRGLPAVALTENQEGLFFLMKHPSGKFYTFNWMSAPVDSKTENFKATVASVKHAFAVAADPVKALKAERAEDRAFAAIALILKNRTAPTVGEIGIEKMPADESKLILKALADADWTKVDATLPAPSQAFYMLGITTVDGWVQPKPGQPGTNFNEILHKSFAKWIDDGGKDYRINKYVVKRK